MIHRNRNSDKDASDSSRASSSSSSSSSDESDEGGSYRTITSADSTISSTGDDSSSNSSIGFSDDESLLSSAASSSPSSSSSRVTSESDAKPAKEWREIDDDDSFAATKTVGDFYSSGVRDWTEKVPIGMNLCPWAKLSQNEGRIRYVTCPERIRTPQQASEIVWEEIDKLRGTYRSLPPWSTTLVICPHVEAWKTDFEAFEAFVTGFGTHRSTATGSNPADREEPPLAAGDALRAITLVPFHPCFVRWRGLPETICTGSSIRCHRGLVGFSKSPEAHPATVVDPRPPGFGRRRIRVRFHERGTGRGTTEQCVPVEWVVLDGEDGGHDTNDDGHHTPDRHPLRRRPPLPDNKMHRSPYPVVHILRNEDLAVPTIHEISRLKRRNAKRMAFESLS